MQGFDAASRFSLTDAPKMAPGVDFITRSDKGPFVDTGRDITFNETGRAYLSLEIIREMAEGAGLFDPIREEAKKQYELGHEAGYLEATKENIGGRIGDLSDELGHLASWLGVRAGLVVAEDPEGESGVEPAVLVTDDRPVPRAVTKEREDADSLPLLPVGDAPSDDEVAGNPFGQGTRVGSNKRSRRVSAGASDGNAYQL